MPAIKRRNVLFCLFDSLSATESDAQNSLASLPTFSRLRSEGAVFTRAYAPNPEGSPARASVFTGLDPCVHGLWTNGVVLPVEEQTLTQSALHAGYATCLAGRYQLAGMSNWTTEMRRANEFSSMFWAHGPLHRSRQNAYITWLKQAAPTAYSHIFPTQANPRNTQLNDHALIGLKSLPDELSFNYWVGHKLEEWMSSQSNDTPLLAIAGFSVGNTFGTEPNTESDGESVHLPALKQADAAIGRLLQCITEIGHADDTVVIAASARGNSTKRNKPMELSEGDIAVPLIIHGKGINQTSVHEPVSTIDIAPTILELMGIALKPRMQGQSLLGVLDGLQKPRGWAMSRVRRCSSPGNHHWLTAYCNQTMKLVVRHDVGEVDVVQGINTESICLYDLESDPREQVNLARDGPHAATLESMIDEMIDARCALEDRTEPRIAEF